MVQDTRLRRSGVNTRISSLGNYINLMCVHCRLSTAQLSAFALPSPRTTTTRLSYLHNIPSSHQKSNIFPKRSSSIIMDSEKFPVIIAESKVFTDAADSVPNTCASKSTSLLGLLYSPRGRLAIFLFINLFPLLLYNIILGPTTVTVKNFDRMLWGLFFLAHSDGHLTMARVYSRLHERMEWKSNDFTNLFF